MLFVHFQPRRHRLPSRHRCNHRIGPPQQSLWRLGHLSCSLSLALLRSLPCLQPLPDPNRLVQPSASRPRPGLEAHHPVAHRLLYAHPTTTGYSSVNITQKRHIYWPSCHVTPPSPPHLHPNLVEAHSGPQKSRSETRESSYGVKPCSSLSDRIWSPSARIQILQRKRCGREDSTKNDPPARSGKTMTLTTMTLKTRIVPGDHQHPQMTPPPRPILSMAGRISLRT